WTANRSGGGPFSAAPCPQGLPLPYLAGLESRSGCTGAELNASGHDRLVQRNFGSKSRERAAPTVWEPRAPDSIIAIQTNAERECGVLAVLVNCRCPGSRKFEPCHSFSPPITRSRPSTARSRP